MSLLGKLSKAFTPNLMISERLGEIIRNDKPAVIITDLDQTLIGQSTIDYLKNPGTTDMNEEELYTTIHDNLPEAKTNDAEYEVGKMMSWSSRHPALWRTLSAIASVLPNTGVYEKIGHVLKTFNPSDIYVISISPQFVAESASSKIGKMIEGVNVHAVGNGEYNKRGIRKETKPYAMLYAMIYHLDKSNGEYNILFMGNKESDISVTKIMEGSYNIGEDKYAIKNSGNGYDVFKNDEKIGNVHIYSLVVNPKEGHRDYSVGSIDVDIVVTSFNLMPFLRRLLYYPITMFGRNPFNSLIQNTDYGDQ